MLLFVKIECQTTMYLQQNSSSAAAGITSAVVRLHSGYIGLGSMHLSMENRIRLHGGSKVLLLV